MQRMLFAGALGAVLISMGVVRQGSLESRLASLEQAEQAAPRRDEALLREIERLARELAGLRRDLDGAEGDSGLAASLDARIAAVDAALEDARELFTLQGNRLNEVGEQVCTLRATAATEARLVALEHGLEQRVLGLTSTVDATLQLAQETRARIERTEPNPSRRWCETLGPTVQLAGDTTVGSGVLLESRPLGDGAYETLLLTCWHVVRDIQAGNSQPDGPVPVAIYSPDGSRVTTTATVIAANVDIDACLLRLVSNERVPHGARLPSRATLAASNVYDPVVAVGCPLGNDPIPTLGNLSSLHHMVDGHEFWMISAPTYIGNSGGGIYAAGSHHLLGLFSKIYTHGSIRPVIVPHMGLVTPLAEIYDWLEDVKVAQVIEREDGTAQVVTGP